MRTKHPLYHMQGDPPCAEFGLDSFFPEKGVSRHSNLELIRICCDVCPITEECLDWALRNENYGIWGGTTARQRVGIRKARNIPQPVDPDND